MATALFTFTLLWLISCTSIYFKLLRRLEEAQRLYDDASEKNRQAAQDNEAAAKRLRQIEASLNCLN